MSSALLRYIRSRVSLMCTPLSIGLLIALLCAGLFACASYLGSHSSSPPTPVAQITSSTHVQLCGKVQTAPNGALLDAAAAKQATGCFWQAYQHCYAASFTFTSSGTDTAIIRTFTVENKSDHCVISDVVQDVMGPNPASAAKAYTCASVTQQSDGLHFASCGQDGDVFVPIVVAQ